MFLWGSWVTRKQSFSIYFYWKRPKYNFKRTEDWLLLLQDKTWLPTFHLPFKLWVWPIHSHVQRMSTSLLLFFKYTPALCNHLGKLTCQNYSNFRLVYYCPVWPNNFMPWVYPKEMYGTIRSRMLIMFVYNSPNWKWSNAHQKQEQWNGLWLSSHNGI